MKENKIYLQKLKNNDFVDRFEEEIVFKPMTLSEASEAIKRAAITLSKLKPQPIPKFEKGCAPVGINIDPEYIINKDGIKVGEVDSGYEDCSLNINEEKFLHEILMEKKLQKDEDGGYKILEDLNKDTMLDSIIRKLLKSK